MIRVMGCNREHKWVKLFTDTDLEYTAIMMIFNKGKIRN